MPKNNSRHPAWVRWLGWLLTVTVVLPGVYYALTLLARAVRTFS